MTEIGAFDKMRVCFLAIVFFMCSSASSLALAATFDVKPKYDDSAAIVVVIGDFEVGDEKSFIQSVLPLDRAVVVLNSSGGNLYAGIEIGKAIRLKSFSTLVPKNSVCASACAIAWLAGDHRFVEANGQVGFHAAYTEDAGRKISSGMANAMVGAYLNQLGFSQSAIMYVTSAPPEAIQWLSELDAKNYGLEVAFIGGDEAKIRIRPIGKAASDRRPVIWEPLSTTAISITGAVRTSVSAIDFQNGERIKIEPVPGGKSQHRHLFKVNGGTNPPLISGNRLCLEDEPLSYVILDTSPSIVGSCANELGCGMTLETYCNVKDLRSPNSKDEEAGTYSYVKSNKQGLWNPSIDIEEQREAGQIETYCSDVANYDSDPEKWRQCIDSETNAGKEIGKIMEGKNSGDAQDLAANCVGYITGLRGLGSIEYVSQPPILGCLKVNNPKLLFDDCVRRITGKAPQDRIIHWGREQADSIADCFNQSVAKAL